MVVGIATAQKALKDAVNSDDYNNASLLTFFQSLLSDLEDIKKDYDDVESKAKAARESIGSL